MRVRSRVFLLMGLLAVSASAPAAAPAAAPPVIEFPSGGDTVDVGALTIRGTLGEQAGEEAWVMFAVDVSGSTSSSGYDCDENGAVDIGDDFNGDGSYGETLDCEIAGVLALNTSLAAIPGSAERIHVGLVPFGSSAAVADVGGNSGSQDFVSPTDDLDDDERDRTADIVQAAASMNQGSISLFASRSVGTGTSFSPALDTAFNVLATKTGRKVVFLLTDGFGSLTQATLDRMVSLGIEVHPYAIGEGSDRCAGGGNLARIGQASGFPCVYAPDPTSLRAALTGQPAGLDRVEVKVDNGSPVLATVDALGNFAGAVIVTPGFHVATVTAFYLDGSSASDIVSFTAAGGLRFVALGDSYSAGEGLTPYANVPGSSRGCHQSVNGYATLVGDDGFELPGSQNVVLDYVACSGAVLKNITAVPQQQRGETHIVQLSRVDAGADLVAMTIGGNDVGFSEVVKHCAMQAQCYEDGYATLNSGRSLSLRDFLDLRLTLFQPELQSLYETLRERTDDNASIVALNYPELIDDGIAVRLGCFEAGLFDRSERVYLNGVAAELGTVIGNAAHAAGVWSADVIDEFKGHRVCDGGVNTQSEWVVGVDVTDAKNPVGDGSFHPDEDGAAAYARVLTRFLRDRFDEGVDLTPAGLPANPGAPLQARSAALATAAQDEPELTPAELEEVAAIELGAAELDGLAALRGDPTCAGRAALGEQLVISGFGFAPGTSVRASLKAASETAARAFPQTLTVAADGSVAASLIVPADLQPSPGYSGDEPWTVLGARLEGTAPGGALRRLSQIVAIDPPSGECSAYVERVGDLGSATGGAAPSAASTPGVPTALLTLGAAGPTIDIIPGSASNQVEPGGNQVFEVALLSTPAFDAPAAAAAKMRFGHDGGGQTPMGSDVADVDGDGDLDKVLRFMANQTAIACTDTIATLTGVIDARPYGRTEDEPFAAGDRVSPTGC